MENHTLGNWGGKDDSTKTRPTQNSSMEFPSLSQANDKDYRRQAAKKQEPAKPQSRNNGWRSHSVQRQEPVQSISNGHGWRSHSVQRQEPVQSKSNSHGWRSHSAQRQEHFSSNERLHKTAPRRDSVDSFSMEIGVTLPPVQLTKPEQTAIESNAACSGTIASMKETFGFIMFDSREQQQKYGVRNQVFFHQSKARNLNLGKLTLSCGMGVMFVFEESREMSSDRIKLTASLVAIMPGQEKHHEAQADRLNPEEKDMQWLNKPKMKAAQNSIQPLPVGVIHLVRDKNYAFLVQNNNQQDVFMFTDLVSQHSLPLCNGDKLEFSAVWDKHDKWSAKKATVVEYVNRPAEEIKQFVFALKFKLQARQTQQAISELICLDPLWKYLFNDGPYKNQKYANALMTVVNQMLLGSKHQAAQSASLLDCLLESKALNNKNGWKSNAETETIQSVMALMETVLELVPQRGLKALSVLNCFLVTKMEDEEDEDLVKSRDQLLLRIHRQLLATAVTELCKQSRSKGGIDEIEDDTSHWRSLATVISHQELLGDLISKGRNLQQVSVQTGYEDAEDYMETYFRLFRAETFHSIQKGVKDLLDGSLDPRDMAVFSQITVVGLETTPRSLSLALSFVPPRNIRDWSGTDMLMSGNLLCLSPSGKFDDLIWLTVANRDEKMLKRGIMFAELCDFNAKSRVDIITQLQGDVSSSLMVESPNLYKPMGAVLESFRTMDLDSSPLFRAIVEADREVVAPRYIATQVQTIRHAMKALKYRIADRLPSEGNGASEAEVDNMFDSSGDDGDTDISDTGDADTVKSGRGYVNYNDPAYMEGTDSDSSDDFPKNRHFFRGGFSLRSKPIRPIYRFEQKDYAKQCNDLVENTCLGLNASQKKAFLYALSRQVAIIQGPPGTGKTYLGVKLVDVILHCLEPQNPILIITYKNHALDEFIKGLIEAKVCTIEEVVRIGGKSKEPALEKCNLQSLIGDLKSGQGTFRRIKELRERIDAHSRNLAKSMEIVLKGGHRTNEELLRDLTEDQLESLLLKTKWSSGPDSCYYKINKNKNATLDWIQNALLPEIKVSFPSGLTQLIRSNIENPPDEISPFKIGLWNHGKAMLSKALAHWLPSRTYLFQLKKLQDQFVGAKPKWKQQRQTSKVEEKIEKVTDAEQEHVKEQQEAREHAMGHSKPSNVKGHPVNCRFILPIDSVRGENAVIGLNDFPRGLSLNSNMLDVTDLWTLDENERFKLLYAILMKSREQELDRLKWDLEDLEEAYESKKKSDLNRDIQIVRTKRVIAMTISGASIRNELMQAIKPSVVVVEEAAEIIETSLMAALNDNVKHLVMIGDQMQLKPQIDTYGLSKDYSFDVSMMERLIKSGYPYTYLTEQHRMRPEFAELLKDIYPELESNLDRVSKNEKLPFMFHSMYFWTHGFLEGFGSKNSAENKGDSRSKRNPAEAEMAATLALFFLSMNVLPEKVTILSAYLGQTMIIKEKLNQYQKTNPNLFDEQNIQVCTIDQFQGDENDYIIVSLVRSNDEGSIGFLNTLNRRCVAQSRAKKGMYFIGNATTLTAKQKGRQPSQWTNLINGMRAQGCVGETLTIQCPEHSEDVPVIKITTSSQLYALANTVSDICPFICKMKHDNCSDLSHACVKNCNPPHSHKHCPKVVQAEFASCGHSVEKECWVDLETLLCRIKMPVKFSPCGHSGFRECHVPEEEMHCCHPCVKKMECSEEHSCPERCGRSHEHSYCREQVTFTFEKCKHRICKECSASTADLKCAVKINTTLAKCKHTVEKLCSVEDSSVVCHLPCPEERSCKHKCPSKCGDKHDHTHCSEQVNYKFPCGHHGLDKKTCSGPITSRCKQTIPTEGICGHVVQKMCYQDVKHADCHEPCSKTRSCSHPCVNECSQPCDSGECVVCVSEETKQLIAYREAAATRVLELERKYASEERAPLSLMELKETDAEFYEVNDHVTKYAHKMHTWFPTVTRVQKVENMSLKIKFEEAKTKRFGDHIARKFHGTDQAGIEGITKNGFRTPTRTFGQKPGMFGQGIYFATNSSKSAQRIYTKGSNQLLLCEVQLGKPLVVEKSDPKITARSLREKGCDSVFAPRGSQVKNDEFVIFDPAQAYPKYIIHFSASRVIPKGLTPVQSGDQYRRKVMPSRSFDPNNYDDHWYRVAESFLLRSTKESIQSIDIIYNPTLQAAFDSQKADFKSNDIFHGEVLAFHGTKSANVDSIVKNNLDPDIPSVNGRVYGNGAYLSEQAKVSLPYGGKNGLMLFRVLPGKEFLDSDPKDYPEGFHCRKVKSDSDGNGWALVIRNAKQFVPVAVYNLN